MKIILCFTFLIFFSSTYAQDNHSDCSNAFQICDLGDYYFSHTRSFGVQEDLKLENSEIEETNSTWLKFKAEQKGTLEFVIVPENQEDDIDFVLYVGDDCTNLEPVRIMTSGENIGDGSSFDCLGQTGLRASSKDVHESVGCFQFDDNFLKPISLKEGKEYYLLINNFKSERGFSILFTGEENLKLVDNCTHNNSSVIDFEVYPNPAVDEITIWTETRLSNPVEVIMFDMLGRILKRKTYKNMMSEIKLDISDIPSGEYYLRIVSEEYIGLKSIIKI